jgi:hypothetical protein
MKNIRYWFFPAALVLGWVVTSGYVLSRFASLHGTLTQQSSQAQPVQEDIAARRSAEGDGRLAVLDGSPQRLGR